MRIKQILPKINVLHGFLPRIGCNLVLIIFIDIEVVNGLARGLLADLIFDNEIQVKFADVLTLGTVVREL